MAVELAFGVTIVSAGGRTTVPRRVREKLRLKSTLEMKDKILWMQEGDEVVVSKGTPLSSFRKTRLSIEGKAAIPKHIQTALKLNSTLHREDRLVWTRKGDEIVVRKGTPRSIPTE